MIDEDPFEKFENDPDGEDGVRKKLINGTYGERRKRAAQAWLENKDNKRSILELKRSADAEERSAEAAISSADSAAKALKWAKLAAIGTFISALLASGGFFIG